ncbi:hypothetical protein G6F55_014370 [Rhizopus delemar]|nr:hypothetical protein G6F55_014370 [Rhizopus delemar]
MEVLSQSQAEFQASFQVLPTTIRAAGLEAADLAAERANRALSEACRSVAKAASDLRIATRSATNALPATAWRTGIICAASAFAGAVLGAGVVTLLVRV